MFPEGISLDALNDMSKNTLMEHLGIEYTYADRECIKARMPVDSRTHQPFGLLHGGASVALAESLGSVAASVLCDVPNEYPVGLEINANHVRSVRSGFVYGKVSALHTGRSTQVWDIRITDDEERLVCISRLTVAIIKRKDS